MGLVRIPASGMGKGKGGPSFYSRYCVSSEVKTKGQLKNRCQYLSPCCCPRSFKEGQPWPPDPPPQPSWATRLPSVSFPSGLLISCLQSIPLPPSPKTQLSPPTPPPPSFPARGSLRAACDVLLRLLKIIHGTHRVSRTLVMDAFLFGGNHLCEYVVMGGRAFPAT